MQRGAGKGDTQLLYSVDMLSAKHGVLVVDKPAGVTSARVVARVKGALGGVKVGHTGTLDPMATGVLPLCVGEGTKVAGYLLAEDKAYAGEFELGRQTDTLDIEGTVSALNMEAASAVTEDDVLSAMAALAGAIEQVPPMFSALKKDGVRLHKLARAGKVVERAPRAVTIHSFELETFGDRHGTFSVSCTKGTYVRTLVDDLGRALGCGACLTRLRRTRSGQFDLTHAVAPDDVAGASLVSPAGALAHLPSLTLEADLLARVACGQRLPWAALSAQEPPTLWPIRLLNRRGQLVALANLEAGQLRYQRIFNFSLAESRADAAAAHR